MTTVKKLRSRAKGGDTLAVGELVYRMTTAIEQASDRRRALENEADEMAEATRLRPLDLAASERWRASTEERMARALETAREAASALAEIDAPRALDRVMPYLRYEGPQAQDAAAEALNSILETIDAQSAVAAIIDMAQVDGLGYRAEVALEAFLERLSADGDAGGISPLLPRLKRAVLAGDRAASADVVRILEASRSGDARHGPPRSAR